MPKPNKNQKRVVIVGAGFAGLKLAKNLADKWFQVVLLDKNNYHQFQPLLYQVATSGLEPSSISFPLRKVFQGKKNVFIRVTEVQEVCTKEQIIKTEIGNIDYDYLVLAQGAASNFFNNAEIEGNAFAMKSVAEALLIRNSLLQNYEKALAAETDEEREALLNVVIVGGGPTGVELAGAIAEMKQKILPKDYSELNFRQMHIYLVEASPSLLNGMSKQSGLAVESYLKTLGVEVMVGSAVKAFDGKTVKLSDDKSIRSRCLIWAAGVKGSVIEGLDSDCTAPNGRVLVDDFNRVKGFTNVFAIGDIAIMASKLFPKGHPQVAPVAIQQAQNLATNLHRIIEGSAMQPFVYKDKGSMATVGHNLAVAEIGKVRLKGFFAWFTWMAVHLMSIVGIKNRLFVLLNWVWQYFTYDPSLRLIIKPKEKPVKENLFEKVAVLFIMMCIW